MTLDNSDAHNTYIFDPESVTEMVRLIEQDHMITNAMGGPLTGIDASHFHDVIDLACGPGGWVLDVAFANPQIEVTGVDISQTMIDYAKARAHSQLLSNAFFQVMDVRHTLDFADASFDFVNARLLFSVLKRDAWSPFIDECTRILRPGGILRLTEPLDPGVTNSPAFERLAGILLQAMWRAGYGFSPDGRSFGMAPLLPLWLHQRGYLAICQAAHVQNYSAYTNVWIDFYRSTEIAYQQAIPLFVQTGTASEEEVQRIYQQALIEMRVEDFACMGYSTTSWGTKPVG